MKQNKSGLPKVLKLFRLDIDVAEVLEQKHQEERRSESAILHDALREQFNLPLPQSEEA